MNYTDLMYENIVNKFFKYEFIRQCAINQALITLENDKNLNGNLKEYYKLIVVMLQTSSNEKSNLRFLDKIIKTEYDYYAIMFFLIARIYELAVMFMLNMPPIYALNKRFTEDLNDFLNTKTSKFKYQVEEFFNVGHDFESLQKVFLVLDSKYNQKQILNLNSTQEVSFNS